MTSSALIWNRRTESYRIRAAANNGPWIASAPLAHQGSETLNEFERCHAFACNMTPDRASVCHRPDMLRPVREAELYARFNALRRCCEPQRHQMDSRISSIASSGAVGPQNRNTSQDGAVNHRPKTPSTSRSGGGGGGVEQIEPQAFRRPS
jgi:hypothetical protein